MVTDSGKRILLFVGDILLFLLSLYIALSLRKGIFVPFAYFTLHFWSFGIVCGCFILSLYIIGLYEIESLRTASKTFVYILYAAIAAFFGGITVFYLFPSDLSPKLVLLMQMGVLVILLTFWRMLFERYKVRTNRTRAILIGEGTKYEDLKRAINDEKHYPLYFVDHVTMDAESFLKQDNLQAFYWLLKKNGIRIIVADIKDPNISALLPYLYNAASEGILLYDMRRMYQDVFKRMPLTDVGFFWFFENVSFDTKVYLALKRLLDIALAIPVLIIVAILYPFIYIAIKREDGGPVFIRQERLGEHGRIMKITKFRSMTYNDASGFDASTGNVGVTATNKVTKVGAFLRRTRLDEFPQALSVLKGDMSIIGPRTELVEVGRKMSKEFPYYMIRYSVRPGLSGWAQVYQDSSPRGVDGHMEKLEYDFYYIKHRSLVLDTIIMLKTIRILLSRTGV